MGLLFRDVAWRSWSWWEIILHFLALATPRDPRQYLLRTAESKTTKPTGFFRNAGTTSKKVHFSPSRRIASSRNGHVHIQNNHSLNVELSNASFPHNGLMVGYALPSTAPVIMKKDDASENQTI